MTAEERDAVKVIRDLTTRLGVAERRIAYLERDKALALRRAQEAKDEARRLHGLLLLQVRRVA